MNYQELFLWITGGLLSGQSLFNLALFYRDVGRDLLEEYKRRAEARAKYMVDPDAGELVGILEDEFYSPNIYYKDLIKAILVWGLPIVNLVFFYINLGVRVKYKVVAWLESPVLPWR